MFNASLRARTEESATYSAPPAYPLSKTVCDFYCLGANLWLQSAVTCLFQRTPLLTSGPVKQNRVRSATSFRNSAGLRQGRSMPRRHVRVVSSVRNAASGFAYRAVRLVSARLFSVDIWHSQSHVAKNGSGMVFLYAVSSLGLRLVSQDISVFGVRRGMVGHGSTACRVTATRN